MDLLLKEENGDVTLFLEENIDNAAEKKLLVEEENAIPQLDVKTQEEDLEYI